MTGRKTMLGSWDLARLAMATAAIAVDQYTKHLARISFGFPGGEPDYSNIKQVIGEWIQFRLIYNSGAAFGMKPQSILPFLNPTLFYALFSGIAILVLLNYYFRWLSAEERWQKTGVALILSGAVGNLIDRLRDQKVTDFIDVGIPGIPTRWPTFNIADSCVCVGVALILFAPKLARAVELPSQRPDAPASGAAVQGHSGSEP